MKSFEEIVIELVTSPEHEYIQDLIVAARFRMRGHDIDLNQMLDSLHDRATIELSQCNLCRFCGGSDEVLGEQGTFEKCPYCIGGRRPPRQKVQDVWEQGLKAALRVLPKAEGR